MKKIFKISLAIFAAVLMMVPAQQINAQSRKIKKAEPMDVQKTFVAKPLIGVSSFADPGVTSVNLTYIQAVEKAGGVPVVIPVTTDKAMLEQYLNLVDGVLMTGGEDVGPLKYFGEEPNQHLGQIVPERDEFDVMLIRSAVAKGLPLLGICRGEQLLNVAFGGTLYQDIPSQVPNAIKHNQSGVAPRDYQFHSIKIEKGSVLEKVLGCDSTAVNSYHHQAVKDAAPGFKITARAKDGIVEGIEKEGNEYVYGVQFHPEGLIQTGNNFFLPIFKHLIEGAQKYKDSK
jgi:putative glutamine amidotransferase